MIMNGKINETGDFGKGSSFSVHFKKVDVGAIAEEEPYSEERIDVNSIRFDEATVLIVDDIETNRKLIIEYLEPYVSIC